MYLPLIGFIRTEESILSDRIRHSIVSDQGIGKYQYLPLIGGVSERLRIPDHPGIEDDFPGCRAWMTKCVSREDRTVFEYEFCL